MMHRTARDLRTWWLYRLNKMKFQLNPPQNKIPIESKPKENTDAIQVGICAMIPI